MTVLRVAELVAAAAVDATERDTRQVSPNAHQDRP
jgi:hypothetical protein